MTLLVVMALFLGLLVAIEAFARTVALPQEVVRKLAHMSAAVFAAALPYVLTYPQIAVLGLALALLMTVSLRLGIFRGIHGVARATYGEVCFPLGIAALAVAYPSQPAFAFGVLVLGVGDGLAALVGKRYGRRRVPLVDTHKTLWGSGAFLVSCFVICVLLLVPTGASPAYALGAAAAIAFALTPVELVLTYGLDNLVLPTVAASLLAGL
jgi:phytol kinase